MANWKGRGAILAALVAAWGYAWRGELPLGGDLVSSWLIPVDAWLKSHAQYPTVFIFISGLIAAFIFYVLVDWFYRLRRLIARKNLVALRTPGTALRMECMKVATQNELDTWWKKAEDWNNEVIAAIAKIDIPDSLRFATLGYPGFVRPHQVSFINNSHQQCYGIHDCREQLLDRFCDQYSAKYG